MQVQQELLLTRGPVATTGSWITQHEDVIYNDKLDPFTYDNFTPIYDPGATVPW